MTQCTLRLPTPPSVNAMYRNLSGVGRVKTTKYKDWAQEAGWMLNSQRPHKFPGPVSISYVFGPKTHSRAWDLSNHLKAVEDLLVTHCIISDDNNTIITGFSVAQSPDVEGLQLTIKEAA
ncbi:MAG: RusA family crossover junction endodeoxyribonuclease [Roseibium sp.]|nr:RusA family crossover junction endodeoxyribonuclease [Roseibium sp.]